MKLTYRGIDYDYRPPVINYGNSAGVGKYRGSTYSRQNLQKTPVPQVSDDLTYRGVAYHTGESLTDTPQSQRDDQPEIREADWVSVTEEARWLMMDHHRIIKHRQQSMLGRATSKIHLKVDPSKYWNHIQGKVHPSFRMTYERSHAAMS
ncbi:DUF4278 domain-containing protein [Acaryochloris marina NIES-2412]|uniref:DUF4278 domain-containing protein n=1 Tax=Acaryochloris marina TaxID=155978 RepID=UPI004058434E